MASHLYAALTGRARRGARAILFPGAAVAVLLSAAPGHAAEGQAAPMRVAAAAGAPAEPAARPLELGSYLAGHHAFRQRDFGAAARYMSEAVAAQPAAERLLLRALVAKLASGETESARTLARRLLALEPRRAALRAVACGERFQGGQVRGRQDAPRLDRRGAAPTLSPCRCSRHGPRLRSAATTLPARLSPSPATTPASRRSAACTALSSSTSPGVRKRRRGSIWKPSSRRGARRSGWSRRSGPSTAGPATRTRPSGVTPISSPGKTGLP